MATIRRLRFVLLVGLIVVLFEAPDASIKIWGAVMIAFVGYDIIDSLRGSRRALDEVNEMFREADRVRRADPAAAQRLVDGYFQEAERRGLKQRDTLRARAATEIGAAKRLAGLLREDLKGQRDIRERFLFRLEPSRRAETEALIKRHEDQTQAELSELEGTIRRLRT